VVLQRVDAMLLPGTQLTRVCYAVYRPNAQGKQLLGIVAVAFNKNIFGYEPNADGKRAVDVQIMDMQADRPWFVVADTDNPMFAKTRAGAPNANAARTDPMPAIHGFNAVVGQRKFRFDFLPNANHDFYPHWLPRTVAGSGMLLTVLSTCLWATRDARRLTALNAKLTREITQRAEMHRLMQKLLEFREQERELVAHEIHDGFVQDVVGAQMFVEGLAARMTKNRSCPDELQVASQLLTKAIEEGRRLISDLRPVVVDELGLVEAVKTLLREQEQRFGSSVSFRHSANLRPMPTLLERALYRIIQESLTNVKRHSGVQEATVTLIQEDDAVALEVKDGGCGFDPLLVPDDRFGLVGIQERARLLQGKAEIRSAPGQGTCVTVELPLNPEMLPAAPHFQYKLGSAVQPFDPADTVGPDQTVTDDTTS
jgi:signal transduction histidine kinase